jgi:hypothetical protein
MECNFIAVIPPWYGNLTIIYSRVLRVIVFGIPLEFPTFSTKRQKDIFASRAASVLRALTPSFAAHVTEGTIT